MLTWVHNDEFELVDSQLTGFFELLSCEWLNPFRIVTQEIHIHWSITFNWFKVFYQFFYYIQITACSMKHTFAEWMWDWYETHLPVRLSLEQSNYAYLSFSSSHHTLDCGAVQSGHLGSTNKEIQRGIYYLIALVKKLIPVLQLISYIFEKNGLHATTTNQGAYIHA